MAKKPTVTTVSSGFASNTQLNANFTALRDAFDNTLSLDGSSPNAMGADLDLNNNDLLNASVVNTATLKIGGVNVVPSAATALAIKKEFNTVAALLADTGTYSSYAENDYLRVVDGGFTYRVAASGASDQNVTTAGGVKLYVVAEGSVVVRAFGAIPAPLLQTSPLGLDHTAALQAAINYSSANGVEIVLEGDASYFASGLVLKDGTRISGAGRDTAIRPVNSTQHMVLLDEGPVLRAEVKNMSFVGNNVADIHCFYLQARRKSVLGVGDIAHGGLWHSSFDSVTVQNFGGCSMWLRGGAIGTLANPSGAYDYLRPHQWVTLKDCEFERPDGSTWPVVVMTGQVEHVSIIGSCRFDAQAGKTGTNVVISREFLNGSVSGGVNVGGSNISDIAPIAVSFHNCTTQRADLAVWVDRSSSINLRGHWFETLNRGIRVDASARVDVSGSHFANAASDGVSGGYAIRAGSSTVVTGSGNFVTGSVDKSVVRAFARHVSPDLFVLISDAANSTTGLTLDVTPSAGALDAQGASSLMIYGATSPTPVTTITSSLLAGSIIALRVHNDAVVLASGGNLSNLPGGRLVLRAGDAAIFQRHDLGANLVFVGVNRNMFSAARPTSGYYEAGEEVFKPAFTAPASAAYIVGWRRLTTGTGHVLGTDWQLIIRNTVHQRTQNISTTPVAVLALPSTTSTRDDSRLIVVNGTDNTDGGRSFSDLLHVLGNKAVSVLSGLGSLTPAARTYSISGNDLMLAMASGTYSVRAIAQVTPSGDTNFNWT